MNVGIDMDGVITDIPLIIRSITNDPIHTTHIITYRDSREDTIQELKEYGIRYDHLHLPPDSVHMAPWKLSVVLKNDIEVMIEDTPEILAVLPEHVHRIWITNPEIYNLESAIKGLKQ